MADGGPGRLGFTPRVPDGPDRPWTRGRRTRWWLVVPADLAVVGATSLFASAAVHDASRAPGLAAGGAAAIAAGWLAARTVRRRDDHLEAAWPDGALALAVCWAVWTASQWAIAQWAARAAPGAAEVAPGAAGTAPGAAGGGPPSTALVLACFLAVLGGGGAASTASPRPTTPWSPRASSAGSTPRRMRVFRRTRDRRRATAPGTDAVVRAARAPASSAMTRRRAESAASRGGRRRQVRRASRCRRARTAAAEARA